MFHIPGDGTPPSPRWFPVTPGTSTNDTNGTTFATLTGLVAGETYTLHGLVLVSSPAGATAMNTRATGSGGLVLGNAAFSWSTLLASTMNGGSTLIDAWTPFASGLGSTSRVMTVGGVFEVTTDGDLLLQFRSETAGSAVNVLAGELELVTTT